MSDVIRPGDGSDVDISNDEAGPLPRAGTRATVPGASGPACQACLAQLSHDLRTPLNAIIGFTELLQDRRLDPSSPDYHEALDSIAANGRRLLSLVGPLLTRLQQHGQAEPCELPLLPCEPRP